VGPHLFSGRQRRKFQKKKKVKKEAVFKMSEDEKAPKKSKEQEAMDANTLSKPAKAVVSSQGGFVFLDQAVKKKRAEDRAKISDKPVKEEGW
jgi:hypothetical protein